MSTSISSAILSRRSVRQFVKNKSVSDELIKEMIEIAKRAPSGGNLQPWHIHVLNGESYKIFLAYLLTQRLSNSEYDIYPKDLQDPYKKRRSKVTTDLYKSIDVSMSDQVAKFKQVNRNFIGFDAPCLLLFTLKKYMGPPQWADVGMFMQSLCLLALEKGLATCPQEAWANHSKAIKQYLKIPDDDILFCGLSIGYEDLSAPINQFRTERAELNEFTTFHTPRGKL